ncbi:MAG: hypothetical protein QXU26_03520 [Thermofilaceae archaeon]
MREVKYWRNVTVVNELVDEGIPTPPSLLDKVVKLAGDVQRYYEEFRCKFDLLPEHLELVLRSIDRDMLKLVSRYFRVVSDDVVPSYDDVCIGAFAVEENGVLYVLELYLLKNEEEEVYIYIMPHLEE